MRVAVIYESMFGNTHDVAEHIAEGLRSRCAATVVPVGEATAEFVASADLIVVGGPTHVHGLSSARSRDAARELAQKEDDLDLEDDPALAGVRDWLAALGQVDRARAAAFDTRIDAPALLTGRAAKKIATRLARHGFELVAEPESFLVDRDNHLLPGEQERAVAWGERLAGMVAPHRIG